MARRGTRRGRLRLLALAALALACALTAAAWAAAGGLDTSFSGDGKRTTGFPGDGGMAEGSSAALYGDGGIVVAGGAQQPGHGEDFAVARFSSHGSLDTDFSSDGRRTTGFGNGGSSDFANGVAVQRDGRIVLVGFSTQPGGQDFAVARLDADGRLDTGFSSDGRRTATFGSGLDQGRAVAIQRNGKIVVAGVSDQGSKGDDFAVARFNPTGSLDTSFAGDGKRTFGFVNGSANDTGRAVAIQSDGKIVVGGQSAQGATGTDFAVARLTPSGGLDTSFSGDGKRTIHFTSGNGFDGASGVAVQGNGKIVLVGEAGTSTFAGSQMALARLNPNGSPDDSFSGDGKRLAGFANPGHTSEADAVALQRDGRIVVAGRAGEDATGADFAAARFKTNGNLDTSFAGDGRRTVSFDNGNGYDLAGGVAIDGDGQIVLAGYSGPSYSGTFPPPDEDFAVVRLLG
jgi:uncharacterized delta-60 repeat protein